MHITLIHYSLQIECKDFVTGRTELTPACNASLDKTRPKQKLSALEFETKFLSVSTHSYSPKEGAQMCGFAGEKVC